MDSYEKSLQTLELPAVLALLAAQAVSETARTQAMALRPSGDRAVVATRLGETSAAASMMVVKGSPSFSGVKDVRAALQRADMGGALNTRELLDIAGDSFDLDLVRKGELTPMFFGSAITNFGVEPFLTRFLEYSTPPASHESDVGPVAADDPDFSGFIFKIQANMNPAHRDRLAFMRICSGVFTKGMTVWHSGSGKMIQLKQPQQFMADEREAVENAYPGDIIGLFDPGIFALGDSLCTGKKRRFPGIPMFAPEFFARVSSIDSLKRKQFVKGVLQLSEEGAIQTFKRPGIGFEEIIVGVVGVLQFEVLEHRLKTEYNAEIRRQQLPYRFVRWITKSPKAIEDLKLSSTSSLAKDARERDVILFENEWSIRWALENNEGLELAETASRLG